MKNEVRHLRLNDFKNLEVDNYLKSLSKTDE